MQEYIGLFFRKVRIGLLKELHEYLVEENCKENIVEDLRKEMIFQKIVVKNF